MTNLLSEEKSLPQKISEDIITLILEENLQPGDKLPNETILSERLNAGRSSVREAMKLLEEGESRRHTAQAAERSVYVQYQILRPYQMENHVLSLRSFPIW